MLLVFQPALVGLWVKLLATRAPQLYAGILIFATAGGTACGRARSIFT